MVDGVRAEAIVAVVVLNWMRADTTLRCLAALAKLDRQHRTYVVDNGSGDASATRIVEGVRSNDRRVRRIEYLTATRMYAGDVSPHPGEDEVIVVETDRNLGYGGGNNAGIALALLHGADFVWILNNDTIPASDALGALLAAAEPASVGMVGALLLDVSGDLVQSVGGGRYNRWTSRTRLIGSGARPELVGSQITRPDFISGAAMLLARDMLVQVGGFEEGFHLYCEEIDLAHRALEKGWDLAVAPTAVVRHEFGATLGSNLNRVSQSAASFFYATRSSILLARKERRWLAVITIIAARLALAVDTLRVGRWDAARAVVAGILAGIRRPPRFRHDLPRGVG